jgi:hypothetical protein
MSNEPLLTEPGKLAAEERRLREDARREKNWKRWGPYLSEREWGTVREDYSPDGSCWEYFHGESGQGLGTSHYTGWTALVTRLLEDCCTRSESLRLPLTSDNVGVSRDLVLGG